MNKNYCGIIGKTDNGYEIYSHCSSNDLSGILKYYWQEDIETHIQIKSSTRKILDEIGHIEYDRNTKFDRYTFHINKMDIEKILKNNLGKLLDININVARVADSEDNIYGAIYKS